jgi:UrcA family protein
MQQPTPASRLPRIAREQCSLSAPGAVGFHQGIDRYVLSNSGALPSIEHRAFATNAAKLNTLTQEIVMNSNIKTDRWAPLAFSSAMVLACVSVASSAFADDQVRTEAVNFQDLNANTPAGVKALYSRIHGAATRVCSVLPSTGQQIREWRCVTSAVAQAIEKANLPALTAYYQMKSGSHPESLTATR